MFLSRKPGSFEHGGGVVFWKKISAALVVVAFLLGSASALALAAKTKVRIWDFHVHDKKYRTKAFKEFNRKNPDVEIDYTSQVNSVYATLLQAAWTAGSPPDIFVENREFAVEQGWAMPIDELAPNEAAFKAWVKRFPLEQGAFMEGINVFGGKTYSWPVSAPGAYFLLYYNKNLFREAGLVNARGLPTAPETWDELRDYARKITAKGNGKYYGIIRGVKNEETAASIAWTLARSAGWHGWFDAGYDMRTGKFDLRTGLRGAIQLWIDMKKDGSVFPGEFTMDEEQARRYFANEKAAMLFDGWWTSGGVLAYNPKFTEFDVVLPPTPERGVRKGFGGAGPLAQMSEYVVSSRVKDKDKAAVWKVIQFLTSEEYQVGWVNAGGGFSVFPEYNKPESFGHPTMAKIAALGPASYRVSPIVPVGSSKVYNYLHQFAGRPNLTETIWGIYLGKLTWSALDDLERRYTEAFEKAIAQAQAEGAKVSKADYYFPDWDPTTNYVPKGKKG